MTEFITAMALQPEDGLSCKVIIYALAGVVSLLAAYIAKTWADRLKDYRDFYALSETLHDVVDTTKRKGETR